MTGGHREARTRALLAAYERYIRRAQVLTTPPRQLEELQSLRMMLDRIVEGTAKNRRLRDVHRLALACQEAILSMTSGAA